MAKVISGCVNSDGTIYEGEGFTVQVDDYGYRITFNTLTRIPNVVAQPWRDYGRAISCNTLGQLPAPVTVTIQTVDERGDFYRNAFDFIAVSNE